MDNTCSHEFAFLGLSKYNEKYTLTTLVIWMSFWYQGIPYVMQYIIQVKCIPVWLLNIYTLHTTMSSSLEFVDNDSQWTEAWHNIYLT